jgi:hypothetical protein
VTIGRSALTSVGAMMSPCSRRPDPGSTSPVGQLVGQVAHSLDDLECRAHRLCGIVLADSGNPKTATTASPMYFSTLPPQA